MLMNKRMVLVSVAAFALAGPALAQKKYDPGVTDTEIKIGNIMPYSGAGLGLRHDRQARRPPISA